VGLNHIKLPGERAGALHRQPDTISGNPTARIKDRKNSRRHGDRR
jgi:hypothetical protein